MSRPARRTYLLDANVLIALTVAEHEHHVAASEWAVSIRSFALCPVVEGALVRFLVRIGERATVAQEILRALHADARCAVWPDELSYADVDLTGVAGHRQVTDAYLVGLATGRRARLASFDAGLVAAWPRVAELIPAG